MGIFTSWRLKRAIRKMDQAYYKVESLSPELHREAEARGQTWEEYLEQGRTRHEWRRNHPIKARLHDLYEPLRFAGTMIVFKPMMWILGGFLFVLGGLITQLRKIVPKNK